jgi:O-methyltransferase
MNLEESLAAVNGISLVDHERLTRIWQLIRSRRGLPGAAAEVGVYMGGSALVISSADPDRDLYLFDTFDGNGMPLDDIHPDGHRKGDFSGPTLDSVKVFLAGRRVHFRPGFFPESAVDVPDQFAFVHIDGDLESTTRDAIKFFLPRMVKDGVIVWDDFDWGRCPGVRRATEEAGLKVQDYRQQAVYIHS